MDAEAGGAIHARRSDFTVAMVPRVGSGKRRLVKAAAAVPAASSSRLSDDATGAAASSWAGASGASPQASSSLQSSHFDAGPPVAHRNTSACYRAQGTKTEIRWLRTGGGEVDACALPIALEDRAHCGGIRALSYGQTSHDILRP